MLRIIFSKKTLSQLLETLVLVFFTLVLVFISVHLIPGQTSKLADATIPLEQQKALIKQYGLDQPLITQFLSFLSGIFRSFDFGISIFIQRNQPVTEILGPKIFLSFAMGTIALFIAFFVGYFLGAVFGINFKNVFGGLGHVFITFIIVLPSYVISIIIVTIASNLGYSNLVIFDLSNPATWVLPILTLSIPYIMTFANLVSGVIKTESQLQYIKFARAKGLSNWQILKSHLFKRGIFSSLVYLPSAFVGVMLDGLFVDTIFSIPGIGSVLGNSILSKDYDVIQTMIILFAILNSVAFWVRDLLLVLIDPRISDLVT